MLGVSWKEKRTNASILSELDVKKELLGKIMILKLAYFGHIMRGSSSPHTLQIVEGMVKGKRKRGRQKKSWFDNIKEWTGLSYNEDQTQCTKQISMEENDKEMCRRWSPIVRSDGGSEVAR